MTVFTSAASLQALLAQATPAGYGAAFGPSDVSGGFLSVQISIRNVAQSVWDSDVSFADTATWDDTNYATWSDVSAYVRGLEWDRGCTDPIMQPEVGTATVTLDNRTGIFSPWATTGAFQNPTAGTQVWDQVDGTHGWDLVSAGGSSSLIRPGTVARFGALFDAGDGSGATWHSFFSGEIETVTEDSESFVDAWVTLGLVDVCAPLASVNDGNSTAGLFVAGSTGATMFSDLFTDIVNQYKYAALSTVPAGDAYFGSPGYQVPDATVNRLVLAQLIAASGNAFILATSDGMVLVTNIGASSSTTYTFANNPSGAELPVVKPTPYSSTDRLLNSVTGTRVGGAAQTATDSVSAAQFGTKAQGLGWPRTDLLLQTDAAVLALVTNVVNQQSNDFLGVSALEVDADQDPVNLYRVLSVLAYCGLEQQKQFAVRWVHPSAAIFTETVRLIGFHHNITMEGSQAKWTATLRTARVS